MEVIKQGKLRIVKGEKIVKITSETPILKDDEGLWSFVDGLIIKGYSLHSVVNHSTWTIVVLTKD